MVKVTFKDVAQLAGVSTQTVSRVTNNASNVTESTRQRVRAAIEQLGYIPSKNAQLLGRRQSRLIGLVTLDLTFFGAAMVAGGIRRAAQEHGYSVALAVVDDISSGDVMKAIQELRSQQVDAVVINMPIAREQAVSLTNSFPDMPIVFADTYPAPDIVTVMSDHGSGARLIVEHLISNRRTRFFFVNGPGNSPAAGLRRQNWIKALQERELEPVGEVVANWSAHEAYQQVTEVLKCNTTIDTILCANDQMALGVLKALHDHGLSVPQDVAVTGFDDTPDSAVYQPALTTVQQDFTRLGEVIVENTLQMLSGNNADATNRKTELQQKVSVTVPVSLVIRESSTQV
ncbi:LacI family DNA-binding transcriptional regulator [Salinisphaera sp. G21_0]|uniref:LacI family DNA-binding transcriptional regulator n=1 Tax=Salinisphaera sp. G21_0 TaxID=2821094 RepID=UPI001ADBA889|nr:LacI family DNA-binding transcriptional regulator [Salinisphaera sp. G21_0]MBO9483452.1 substrate-binding domain-containing protein [Salinisphaera sp. G21_0]